MMSKRRSVPKSTAPEEVKLAGEMHRQIPVDEIQDGDYCRYYDKGWRLGRVKKNHKGYKYKWVRLFPRMREETLLEKSKKIKHEIILCGWRKIEAEGN